MHYFRLNRKKWILTVRMTVKMRERIDLPSPYSNSSEGDISDDSDVSPAVSPLTPLLTTNQRKRSGALQRQQLLEIIQANMEKNNLSFHTSRYALRDQPHVKYRDIFSFKGKGNCV